VIDGDAPFRQQFFDVSVGKAVAQVPADGDDDHIWREAEPREARPQGWYSTTATTHRPSLPDLALHRRNSPSNPTHSPERLTSFLLRHHKPAPNDGVDVKDLRPLTRSAYRADPGPRRRNRRCPKAAEDERKKINQPWDGTA
jgi:hypothetical protein